MVENEKMGKKIKDLEWKIQLKANQLGVMQQNKSNIKSMSITSTFFHKDPNYLLKWFLGPIAMVKVPKNAHMCQILAIFSVL